MTTLQLESQCRRMPLPELRRELRYWIRETLDCAGRDRSHAINRRQVVWSEMCHRERNGRLEGLTADVIYLAEQEEAGRERKGLDNG